MLKLMPNKLGLIDDRSRKSKIVEVVGYWNIGGDFSNELICMNFQDPNSVRDTKES